MRDHAMDARYSCRILDIECKRLYGRAQDGYFPVKYCRFVDARGSAVVYVNPAAVRYLRSDPDEPHTRIVFDDNLSITVKTDIEDVAEQLQEAQLK